MPTFNQGRNRLTAAERRTRSSWYAMHARCYRPGVKNYDVYGGRGIRVCARWFNNYANFELDMGLRPEGTSLDRKDVNGDYSPENCRWADAATQYANRRNSRLISYAGKTLSRKAWAKALQVSDQLFGYYLKKMPETDAIATLMAKAKENEMSQAKHSIAAMVAAGFTSERGVRFWEEKGLLGPVERTAGDVRRYTDAQLGMATIIAAAKFGGWSLDDIAGMLKGWDAEAYEAIVVRLRDQARAAIRLAESLPMPPKRADAPAAVEYDL